MTLGKGGYDASRLGQVFGICGKRGLTSNLHLPPPGSIWRSYHLHVRLTSSPFRQPSHCCDEVCLSALPTTPTSRKTALNAVHRQMGAKMVEFNGWDMPVEYPTSGGIIAEHMAVRTGVGIFDVSHMGDIRLSGPGALAGVQHISMNDAARLAVGQAQYSALLYPQGTFVDDVIVHRLADDEYLLVINASTREKDFNWVRENTRNFDCRVENLSDDFTQIAIQGPRAVVVLQKLTDADLSSVKFYWVMRGTVCGLRNILIARTGYTGEDGFEIYIPADEATSARVWNEILKTGKDLGILPCGLGARNTLRLEAKLPLYEHEISDTINVWEAGLDRFCKMDNPEFKYTKQHEWIKADGDSATVGITNYAQESLGDIVFVETPKVGAELTAGKAFGTVESVKAVSDLYAPASGTVTEVNGELATAPEKINKDAHIAWIMKIKLKNPGELNSLLSAADYEKFVAEEGGH